MATHELGMSIEAMSAKELTMTDAYDELLRESCQTIVDLRFELQEMRKKIADQKIMIRGFYSRPEWGAFCDEISEEEWDGEPEFTCSTCGAPVSEGHSGRCSMPCI